MWKVAVVVLGFFITKVLKIYRVLKPEKHFDLSHRLSYAISFDVCLSVYLCISVEKKNQLDTTECFIALICSTCFGQLYVHHQELETICVLLPPMVCSAWLLVVGGQVQGRKLCLQEEGNSTTALQSCYFPLSGRIAFSPAPDLQQPATKHCTP